jgi:hypothetical protein
MTKEEPYPVPYYLMVIGRFLESFSPEQSAPGSFSDEGGSPKWYSVSFTAMGRDSGIVFSRSGFAGAHLWRERRLSHLVCMSNELQAEIKRAGLRIWKHWPMREV